MTQLRWGEIQLHTYMFVVVNFDALAQASEFRIERRQFVFQFEAGKSEIPNRRQTECPFPNRLSSRGWSKTWTQQPVPMMSEHSAQLTSLPIGFRTWPWGYTCCLLLISMSWHRQVIFESKADKLSSSAEWMQDRKLGSRRHQIANRENVHSQTDWVIEDQATIELDTCIHTYVRRYVRAYIHIYINFLEYSKVYSIFVWVYDTETFKSLYHLEHHGMALFYNTSLLWGECHETHLLISQLWFG